MVRLGFVTPELPKDRHLFVEFEGVAMRAKVFCNGQQIGQHEGMFSRFSFDLTPTLKPGANLLAVFVSMEKIPPSTLFSMGEAVTVNLTASKVRSLSKGMFGPLAPGYPNKAYDLHGIWQPVKLKMRDSARLDDVWFSPSLDGAEVRIQAGTLAAKGKALNSGIQGALDGTEDWSSICRNGAGDGPCQLQLDCNGLVAKCETTTLDASHAKSLYVASDARVGEKRNLLDAWEQKVGFRTFEIHGNQFYLNGKPYWLRGAGNHIALREKSVGQGAAAKAGAVDA